MKNRLRYSALLLLAFFTFQGVSSSQLSLSVGPVLGLTTPTVDYTGETSDFYTGTKYGMRSGINYGAMARVVLGPINGKLSVSYASLDNTGKGSISEPNSTLTVKNNLFMITLGTEFGFAIPFSPVRPYAGLDLLFTSISGTFNYQGTSKVSSGETTIQSSSRTGLGLNLGAEFKLGKSMGLDLSLHYNLINLFGKDFKSTGTNRIDSYTNLNDAKDPAYSPTDDKHPLGSDRTIATIQIQLGLLFGF